MGEDLDDSEGSDDEKGNDMCMRTSGPAASGANAGGTTASGASTDWVFTKRSGRLQILLWKAWQAFYEQQVVAKMPGRERDLHLYHVVFGGASLLDVLNDTAAAGAKDSAAAASGVKSSHWASPAVIKEAKDFTGLKWKRECAIRD